MAQNMLNSEPSITENRERIFVTLNELCCLSRSMISENTINLQDAQRLSLYVTSMRVLLADLEQIEDRLDRPDQTIASVRNLKEQFWELEGMVKEVRNNLDRERALSIEC